MKPLSKESDQELKSLFSEPREKPSVDFTAKVMASLPEQRAEVFIYRPPVSKKGWLVVSAFFVLLIVSGSNTVSDISAGFSSVMSNAGELFSGINALFETTASTIDFSPVSVYILLGLALLVLSDILLKRRSPEI